MIELLAYTVIAIMIIVAILLVAGFIGASVLMFKVVRWGIDTLKGKGP